MIDKLDFIKVKNFCSEKDTVKAIRGQVKDWVIYLQKSYLMKDCYTKYKKHFSNSKKMKNLIRKWVKDLNRHLIKEDILKVLHIICHQRSAK